jgi:transposase-like protein
MSRGEKSGRQVRAGLGASGTFMGFMERYPDEESCERKLLEEAFPGGFVCPRCGCTNCSRIRGRAHRWRCTRCSRQFSVTAGTMTGRTHLPLRDWFLAIWLCTNDRRGLLAAHLQRMVGCNECSTECVLRRIRCAMDGSECPRRA